MSGAGEARQRAADFVAAHGEALARHRSAALLGASAQPALDALAQLDPALPGALARVVAVCDELGALRSVVARDALARLEAGQADDGAFARASLPLSERLRLTGDLGGILARSPYGRPESLASAGDFLARHFTPDRLQGFQWGNVAAYARYFANTLHDAADEILQWCGRELERGFRAREFDALQTARVLVQCDAHGLPGGRLEREEVWLGLLSQQAPDGSFGEDPEPPSRVEATLQGLRALGFVAGGSRAPALDSRVRAR